MNKAIYNLSFKPNYLLIDGNYFKNNDIEYTAIIKGDSLSFSIAAASIIAKVSRDNWMTKVADKLFPQYRFAKHKGYATKEHFNLLEKYGTCPIHRKTFLSKFYNKIENNLFG